MTRNTPHRKLNKWMSLSAVAIVALGVVAQLWVYTHRQSFWKDETGLARNFFGRTLANIHLPLPDVQAAPIGFMQLSKLAEMVLGHSEHTFWLLPLALGLLSLPLAAVVWRRLLPAGACLVALGLWALNPTVLMHITQLKPYLSDAVMTVLLTGAFFYYRAGRAGGAWVYLGTGLLALWMSYTSVFVLAGFGLWMVIDGARTTRRAKYLRLWAVNIILGLTFVLLWIFNYSGIDPQGGFKAFWAANFAPLPGSERFPGWYLSDLPTVLGYLFGQQQWLLWAFLLLVGIGWAARQRKELLVLLVPVGLTFAASWAGAYPIYDRLEMFWLPLLLPLVAVGVHGIYTGLRPLAHGAAALLVVCVGLAFVAPLGALPGLSDPQELKQVAVLVQKKAQPGQVVYLHHRAAELYRYYFRRYPLAQGVQVVYGTREETQELHAALKERFAGQHVWVLFTEASWAPSEIELLAYHTLKSNEQLGVADFARAGALELSLAK